jgi:outer membrane lipoprotein-sorting protein
MNKLRLLGGLLLCAVLTAPARAITVGEIVERGKHVLDGVNDFVCLMTFSVSSADMRVPDSKVRIFFKKPDKFRAEAVEGDFAVLPKTYHLAVGNVLERMVKENDTTYDRDENLGPRAQYVLRLLPKDENSPFQGHWVYVDQEHYTVTRIISYPRDDKPVVLSCGYQAWGKAFLVSSATIDGQQKRKDDDGEHYVPLRIKLAFTKYRVNVGLKDEEFK